MGNCEFAQRENLQERHPCLAERRIVPAVLTADQDDSRPVTVNL